MRPSLRSRIYLAGDDRRYKFLWVAQGSDGSLYLGSSAAKHFSWGRAQTLDVPASGRRIDLRAGREMKRGELRGKHSFHRSGLVLGRERSSGHARLYVAGLREGNEVLPLASILPMQPAKYPLATRQPRPADVTLDVSEFLELPFAVLVFLQRTGQPDPPVISHSGWTHRRMFSLQLRTSHHLRLLLYSNNQTFRRFPEREVWATPRPEPDGGLNWLVFVDSP